MRLYAFSEVVLDYPVIGVMLRYDSSAEKALLRFFFDQHDCVQFALSTSRQYCIKYERL